LNLAIVALLVGFALLVTILAFFEFGRRLGVARLARDPEGEVKGSGAAEAAVFGLLGLMLAFTFSGAANRFETRRLLIAEEANTIGTAWLRLDLLPAASRLEIRDLFRTYTELRASVYRGEDDIAGAVGRLQGSKTVRERVKEIDALQLRIWTLSVAATQSPDAHTDATRLLLPALNDMIDITTTRAIQTINHPPLVVYLLLIGLSLGGALLIGYDMASNKLRSRLHAWTYATVIALSVYVIVDLEFPRLGLIRVDAADQVLFDLRSSFGDPGS